jgi:hypothetical protein
MISASRAARALIALALLSFVILPLKAGPTPAQDSATAVPPVALAMPRVWLVRPGQPLSQALRSAADGDIIELLPGDYTERLLIQDRRLTIRGVRGSEPPRVVGGGQPVAARALWTIQGGEVLLENLEFRGARSNDGAGAAVRQEGGRLVLRRCRFFDNEHGLVALNDPQAEVQVEGGVFGMAPRVVGGLHHLVTIGRIGRFSVTGTRFQQGFEGHLLKTRARETLIAYNFIHDGLRGGASLEIDIALGGDATVIGNVIGQGSASQNPVLLSYGSEGAAWDLNRLRVAHNTFINHGWMPAWFLRVHRKALPPGVELVAVNNLLVGGGVFEWVNEGLFEGNRHATRGALADVVTNAFELPPSSGLRGQGADLRALGRPQLLPAAEFDWTEGRKPLDPPPERRTRWSPGAFQK